MRIFGGDAQKQGWVPIEVLDTSSMQTDLQNGNTIENADFQKKYLILQHYPWNSNILIDFCSFWRAVIRELVETEEEFGRDLKLVVDRYLKATDTASAPRNVRDSKDIIFGNFQQISEFHNMSVEESARERRILLINFVFFLSF